MRTLLRTAAVSTAIILAAVLALAQNPVTVKDTPASEFLSKLATDQKADSEHLNTAFQQARSNLDQNQKSLSDDLKKTQDELNAKLKEDKKYKSLFDHMAAVQKQIQELNAKAQGDYQKNVGPIQQKLQQEIAQIQGLIPVVRKENDLPEDATFDMATGKWTLKK